MKGSIQPGHVALNSFEFFVPNIPEGIVLTKVSGLEDELDVVDLPDRTKASGGRRKPFDFEVSVPAHHKDAVDFFEDWLRISTDPIVVGYKSVATITGLDIFGNSRVVVTMNGVFTAKRVTPDFELNNDGEMAEITFGLCADDSSVSISPPPA